MDDFALYNIDDEVLDGILSLSQKDQYNYIKELIENYYPKADTDTKIELAMAYKGSFVLEKFYRINTTFQETFTAVYTKTGLIRNIVNDIYYTEDDLITH